MKKILIIDDQPDNVYLLKERLKGGGFEVISAYEGESGLKIAFEQIPDLILLDVMMPGMSGFEVCKLLTSSKLTKDIPVILVTALTNAEDVKEGLLNGAYDYIKKPYNKIELLARVNSALRFREATKMVLEIEKANTYAATIITANHEIKQPLTLINLTLTALKRELSKEDLSREALQKRVTFIENGAHEISRILEKLNSIKHPKFTEYVNEVNMIDIDGSDKIRNEGEL